MENDVDKFLEPFLPRNCKKQDKTSNVFVTLTYAQSIDAKIAVGSGIRTKISGPETSVLTHRLRQAHDAVLVGADTFRIDNPGLNGIFIIFLF